MLSQIQQGDATECGRWQGLCTLASYFAHLTTLQSKNRILSLPKTPSELVRGCDDSLSITFLAWSALVV